MKNRLVQHDNWATPPDVYKALDDEFHFDYDPCPLNGTDGLVSDWGKSNYINPPYSRKLKEAFVQRAVQEARRGALCVMLLPVSTSTVLFHDWIKPNAKEIRFVRGRINFLPNGEKSDRYKAGQMDSMIIIFRPQRKQKVTNPHEQHDK